VLPWSPDFPPPAPREGSRKRPSGRLARLEIRGAGGGVNRRAKDQDLQKVPG
jgi:hypothetical protein